MTTVGTAGCPHQGRRVVARQLTLSDRMLLCSRVSAWTRSNTSMTESDEREELRTQRATLGRRTAELERETQRLHGSGDRPALRALHEQIKRHEEDLRVFDERLGAFHARFGPIGEDKKDQ